MYSKEKESYRFSWLKFVTIPFLLVFLFSCRKQTDWVQPKSYVIILAGQSQISGRASITELSPFVFNHTYNRTKIWSSLPDSLTVLWSSYVKPNYKKTTGWESFNLFQNQSFNQEANMHGLEPELAYLFETNHPNDTLYIIKYASGGVPIALSSYVDWNPNSSGELYNQFISSYIKPAMITMQQKQCIPLGFIWGQGETDAQDSVWANDYHFNLVSFFSKLKTDLNSFETFKVCILKIANPILSGVKYKESVRTTQKRFCDSTGSVLIDCDLFSTTPTGHFSSAGYEQLAKVIYAQVHK